MSDACDGCGYRNSEVKGGGGVPRCGRRIELRVEAPEDLRRDVIKAETATLEIPELELEVTTGTLGGLITTVEGLVESVADALRRTQSFALGDGAQPGALLLCDVRCTFKLRWVVDVNVERRDVHVAADDEGHFG